MRACASVRGIPRPTSLWASAVSLARRPEADTACPLETTTPSATITAGRASAHSAVTDPRSARESESTADKVGEDLSHFITAHNDH